MEELDTLRSPASQGALSREELEQHLRARAWKDDAFRQEFLTNPQAVLQRDYAHSFPDGVIPSQLSIKVIEEDEQTICFVLPGRLSDDQVSDLQSIVDEELLGVSGGESNTGLFTIICCSTFRETVVCCHQIGSSSARKFKL